MKIHAHWLRHVEAWRESGLSQAAQSDLEQCQARVKCISENYSG
jgi:hypothetical protein